MLPTCGDKEKYSHLGTLSLSPRNPDFLKRILTKLGLLKYDRRLNLEETYVYKKKTVKNIRRKVNNLPKCTFPQCTKDPAE